MPERSTVTLLNDQGVNTSLENLVEGRALYVESCGGCHYLHLPSEFTIAEWKAVYPEMSTRTTRTIDELEKIQTYLLAGAKQDNSQ